LISLFDLKYTLNMFLIYWLRTSTNLLLSLNDSEVIFLKGLTLSYDQLQLPSNGLCVNDPSAGSPTETLLRLLLPLNGKV
jgi:hypothetical protein